MTANVLGVLCGWSVQALHSRFALLALLHREPQKRKFLTIMNKQENKTPEGRNVLDVPVNFFRSVRDTQPTEVNLYNLLTSDKYRGRVERVRSEPNPEKQAALKKELPAFTVSGTFPDSKADPLCFHSGLVCIDIDAKDNTDVEGFADFKQAAAKIPYIAYCGRSVRGNGFFCIVPIKDPMKHREHFDALAEQFSLYVTDAAGHGIKIDPSGSDVVRKRFVSFDPEPYVNPRAEVHTVTKERAQPHGTSTPEHDPAAVEALRILAQTYAGAGRDPETLRTLRIVANNCLQVETADRTTLDLVRVVAAVCEQGVDITETREAWLGIGSALAYEFGDTAGRAVFHALSQFYPGYSEEECDGLFSDLVSRGYAEVTIGTVFHHAKAAGVWGVSAREAFGEYDTSTDNEPVKHA